MIPSLFRPSDAAIAAYLETLPGRALAYPAEGIVATGKIPRGFVEDHNRARLGSGAACFERAKRAIRDWKMFDLGWIEARPPGAPIAPGTNVAILARTFGAWTLNPARVVAAIAEPGAVERFGFAYGALSGHAEAGEEQFTVEWRHDDDSVWYDLHSFSRPGRWFSWLARPVTRGVQERFARESLAAMARAVAEGGPR